MSTLREYCEAVRTMRAAHGSLTSKGYAYDSVESFLIEHAREYHASAVGVVVPVRVYPQQCFDNAYRLARKVKSLRYVEGLALSVIPMAHAWCVTEDDLIVDPTWARYGGGDTTGLEYFGVPIDIRTAATIRTKHDVAVLHNWRAGLPLLRQRFGA